MGCDSPSDSNVMYTRNQCGAAQRLRLTESERVAGVSNDPREKGSPKGSFGEARAGADLKEPPLHAGVCASCAVHVGAYARKVKEFRCGAAFALG
ncbi:hypothetical protein BPTFM16_00563 [Altererythrobacter insulae]|nr:hypothetical protein BPTFM16_00563 [Altererythrobacter insulae]